MRLVSLVVATLGVAAAADMFSGAVGRLCNESLVRSALRSLAPKSERRSAVRYYRRSFAPTLCAAKAPELSMARPPRVVAIAPAAAIRKVAGSFACAADVEFVGDVGRRVRGSKSLIRFVAVLAAAEAVLVQPPPKDAARGHWTALGYALALVAPTTPERSRRVGDRDDLVASLEDYFRQNNNHTRRSFPPDDHRPVIDALRPQDCGDEEQGNDDDDDSDDSDSDDAADSDSENEMSLLARAYNVSGDGDRLLADVAEYYRRASPELEHCSSSSSIAIPGCTYVLANGGVVHGFARGAGSKQALMDLLLRAATRGRPRGTNASFYLDLRATGVRVRNKNLAVPPKSWRRAPVFTIAHKGGDVVAAHSALAPGPYFMDPLWWANYTREFLDVAETRPWRSRRRQVLFRGGCGPGAAERLKLLAAFPEDDPLVDLKLVSFIGNYSSLDDCVARVAETTLEGGKNASSFLSLRRRVGAKLPLGEYSKYRYLLHMPGAATGSYSRNLQHLFMHGAIVLAWRTTAEEWYYHLLRDRVHYVVVDEHTLADTVREIEANRTLRAVLVAGSRYVATHLLSPDFIFTRWNALLDPLFPKQQRRRTKHILPDTACTCDPRVAHSVQRCAFCDAADRYASLFKTGSRKALMWV